MGLPMNRRVLTILLVAFLIAAICSFLVVRLIRNQAAAARPAVATRVVAAKTDIKLGTVLKPDDLTTIQIAGTVPKGAILEKDESTVIGRGVISDLYEGEPILDNRLAAPGAGGGLAPAIPIGMRACAVKVDEVVGVSGFATQGMRVDVIISGNPPGTQNTTEGSEARTVLQNIQILSAGTEYQQVKDNEGKAKQVQVVNLLVTPEQAEVLELASSQTIRLVLRNPLDTKIAPVSGTATSNLFTGGNNVPGKPRRVAAAKKPASRAFTIEVINGSKTSQEKFASPEGRQ
jgi:pilus assembly protein CpaB